VYWSFFVFTAGFERARAAPQAGQSKAPVGLLLAHGSHPAGTSTGVHAAGAVGFEQGGDMKGVSACAHRDLCGGASGSTDTPPMPRVVLIPMPP